MWALGVTGTYLGDYFGILMNERVTGFPFNINDNPMYNGSTLCFLGTALWYGKPTGILVTLFVLSCIKLLCYLKNLSLLRFMPIDKNWINLLMIMVGCFKLCTSTCI